MSSAIPTFELYEQLVSALTVESYMTDITDTRLKPVLFKKFVDFVKVSDQRIHNTIYALIKHHDNVHHAKILCNVPYGGEHRANGNMKLSFEELPHRLQAMLLVYMDLVVLNDTATIEADDSSHALKTTNASCAP
jgi:hypothetical protein